MAEGSRELMTQIMGKMDKFMEEMKTKERKEPELSEVSNLFLVSAWHSHELREEMLEEVNKFIEVVKTRSSEETGWRKAMLEVREDIKKSEESQLFPQSASQDLMKQVMEELNQFKEVVKTGNSEVKELKTVMLEVREDIEKLKEEKLEQKKEAGKINFANFN